MQYSLQKKQWHQICLSFLTYMMIIQHANLLGLVHFLKSHASLLRAPFCGAINKLAYFKDISFFCLCSSLVNFSLAWVALHHLILFGRMRDISCNVPMRGTFSFFLLTPSLRSSWLQAHAPKSSTRSLGFLWTHTYAHTHPRSHHTHVCNLCAGSGTCGHQGLRSSFP